MKSVTNEAAPWPTMLIRRRVAYALAFRKGALRVVPVRDHRRCKCGGIHGWRGKESVCPSPRVREKPDFFF